MPRHVSTKNGDRLQISGAVKLGVRVRILVRLVIFTYPQIPLGDYESIKRYDYSSMLHPPLLIHWPSQVWE